MQTTACPLDCFDACEVDVVDGVCKPSKTNPITNGKLCRLFGYLQNEKQIQAKTSLNEALDTLVEKLKTPNQNVLYYKGSGNMGVMQNAPKLFFDKYGATFTHGGLCDEAGCYGIEQSRGRCVNPPIQNLINSDVVIVWGRNLTVTSPHIYNMVKDKTIITIDPVKTQIAKESVLHIQLKPKTDHLLAVLLARLAYTECLDDQEFIENNTQEYEWFYEMTQGVRINKSLKAIGTSIKELADFFSILVDKKVAILAGLGMQKYIEGEQIMRTLDAFAATLGLFNKDAGGFWYFGSSDFPFDNPFNIKPKNTVARPAVDFANYDICFIQGANPVLSNPNTQRVIDGLKNTYVVFFGTTDNETAQYADLIIPAKTFLQKKDVRLSYGHDEIVACDVIHHSDEHISEYEFTQYLFDAFNMDGLKSEDELLDCFKVPLRDKPIVQSFEFIEELDIATLHRGVGDRFFLLTSKHKNSICSQFKTDPYLYIHSANGFLEAQKVLAKTSVGEMEFEVKTDDDLRHDCILLYSGSNVNYLTSHQISDESHSATYQDIIVQLEKVEN
ncbi:MAG: molybdopterin-dependent oxidoreductase [Campylobacterota bacterium]|nr:molybdopterin-dependent oxidoreductase [Campylobacterota bacterium]